MQTAFIAVQCFKCSTMQVKQRKKSSNKWTCVQDEEVLGDENENENESLGDVEVEVGWRSANKRTDWTEYIDHDEVHIHNDDDQGDLCEANVVTELPKPLFKKPKLRDDYSAAGLDSEDGAKLRRPVFGKRNIKKKVDNPGYEISFSL
nr:MRN complex-interacting protein [Tanacetum cinerariifolium]